MMLNEFKKFSKQVLSTQNRHLIHNQIFIG